MFRPQHRTLGSADQIRLMPNPRACSVCGKLEKIGENSLGVRIDPRRFPRRKPSKYWVSTGAGGRDWPISLNERSENRRFPEEINKSHQVSTPLHHPRFLTLFLTLFRSNYRPNEGNPMISRRAIGVAQLDRVKIRNGRATHFEGRFAPG